jgi:hypothetical protein
MWMNAKGASGKWSAFNDVGAYDLGLYPGATWSVPPINVTKAPPSRSFWAEFMGWLNSPEPSGSGSSHSVPDHGATATLLATALLGLVILRRKLK